MKSSMRTFSDSGNEFLLPLWERLDALQGFFASDLFPLRPLDRCLFPQGFHWNLRTDYVRVNLSQQVFLRLLIYFWGLA
jgi:hypothetical protein